MTRIVLASTSIYRRQLLARLGLSFEIMDPSVDETPRPGERAPALVARAWDGPPYFLAVPGTVGAAGAAVAEDQFVRLELAEHPQAWVVPLT